MQEYSIVRTMLAFRHIAPFVPILIRLNRAVEESHIRMPQYP